MDHSNHISVVLIICWLYALCSTAADMHDETSHMVGINTKLNLEVNLITNFTDYNPRYRTIAESVGWN
jgi:phytoene/squalene synthetase